MKYVFYALVAIAFAYAAFLQLVSMDSLQNTHSFANTLALSSGGQATDFMSPMDQLTVAALNSAKAAVTLAIGLVGGMALFLGVMKVAEDGGLLTIVAKTLRPITVLLFPDVPANHPAMGAIILNMSANALGLGNAATPFGIRAMQELDKLNPHKGTASNAMALFLAINTSALALLPTGVMVIRQELGSIQPGAIFATTLIATTVSTIAGISAAKIYQRVWPSAEVTHERAIASGEEPPLVTDEVRETEDDAALIDNSAYPTWVSFAAIGSLFAFIILLITVPTVGPTVSPWVIPGILVGMLTFGMARGVNVYSSVVEGAKAGWNVAVMIIPFLVAILVAVGMFRANDLLFNVVSVVGLLTEPFGMPAEALPMALLRPLSGSGAYGVMMDILSTNGPDSYVGLLVSTLQGSTETTFYVLAVYYGAVQVKRIRHTMAAALTADAFGIAGAIGAVWLLYGRGGIGADDPNRVCEAAAVDTVFADGFTGDARLAVVDACAGPMVFPADATARDLLKASRDLPQRWTTWCSGVLNDDLTADVFATCDMSELGWSTPAVQLAAMEPGVFGGAARYSSDRAAREVFFASVALRIQLSSREDKDALVALLAPASVQDRQSELDALAAAAPDVEGLAWEDISTVGGIQESQARWVLSRVSEELVSCMSESGSVSVGLVMTPSGDVDVARVGRSLGDPSAEACIQSALARLTFPETAGETASRIGATIRFGELPIEGIEPE